MASSIERRGLAGKDNPILIVSKEPDLQRISGQLEQKFNLLATASFSEAPMKYLKDNLVDCIVIGLSEKNAELVKVLLYNSKSKYPAIPIVIVANHIDLEMIRMLGSLGADKIIPDTSLRQLLQTVNEVIPNSCSRVRLSDFSIPCETPLLIVKRALLLIEERYIELMSVQEIADYIGVADTLLVKEFRRQSLISPKKLLMLFKVKHAVNLMKRYDLSITTIARLSGFSNSKRFIECFRRVHPGFSPFQFKTLVIKSDFPMFSIYRRFFNYVRPYIWHELLLFFLIGLSSLGALASPYILKIIIDQVFPKKDIALLLHILLCLLAIYTLRILSAMAADYLHNWISNRIVKDIRKKIFEHVLYMDLAYFRNNRTGDLLYKINNEVERIRHVLTSVIIRILDNCFTMIGIMFVLCSLNLRLFLYTLVLFPFIIGSVRVFSPLIKKGYDNISKRESDILHYLADRFTNIKIIKAFNTYSWESSLLERKIRDWIKVDQRTSLLSSANRNISTFLMASGPLLVLWVGGRDLVAGAMTLGSLIAFIQYLNRLYPPALDFLNLYSEILRAAVSMKNVMQIFSEPSLIPVAPHPALPDFKKIEFDRVSVGYDGRPVLRQLSLTFHTGKVYAIVGASGSGKSSLINVLCRFVDTDEGSVTVDGSLLINLNKFAWLDKVALVSQDNNIFTETLRNNIVYGSFQVDAHLLEAVVRHTGIEGMLAVLKEGLDSETGEKGAVLSGGEVQRVMIARALLKKADILILDEATSALDSLSEESILVNIREHYHPPIVIIISHRISTIRHADEVLYLEDGMVKERGSPDRLLQLKGAYYRLFAAQLSDQEIKEPFLQPENA